MRVSTKATYDINRYQLGRLVEDLKKANTVVSSGSRINKLSDDPVGLTQVINLKSNLSNLDQLERNIDTGRTWLNAGETTLSSVKELITDTRVLCLAMSNDTVNASDRADAANQVEQILFQVEALANTRVNGQYVFAGTKTDTMPFGFDDAENPTRVNYYGNESGFAVKTGKDTNVVVGHSGEAVFEESHVIIDETNNHIDFIENAVLSGGVLTGELTAAIPSGDYTADELVLAAQVAMRNASSADGNGIDYVVSYDPDNKSFTIEDGPGANNLDELQLLWETGTHAGSSVASDLGFGSAGDDIGVGSYNSDSGVQWGIFNTLIDLKGYLEVNDVDGIQRSITRLDTHFEHLVSTVSEIGTKELGLDIKETIIGDLNLSYEEKRSKIEDADIIEAISDLQAKELAYQTALASSARVMQLSLVDYLK